jgi:predicted enzyme related to lactoylglutathione lyase
MTITQVQLFSIPVSDQDRARQFYVDVLGFEVVNEADMGPDRHWLQVRPRGSETSITLVTWFDSMPAGSLRGLVLETDDLDAAIADLATRGLDVSGGIIDEPWGRFAQFEDPDGNGMILQTTR